MTEALLAFALTARVTIVTAGELAARLSRVTVLDAREPAAFRRGHVPGGQNVDWKDLTLEKPGAWNYVTGDPARWGRVPPADEALTKRLRELGLSNAKPVVVVGDPSGWGEEGRIAWNLLYWGASDVALLDGGFPAWKNEVEKGAARRVAAGDFTVREEARRRIDVDALEGVVKTKSHPLLDARTAGEFAGEKMSGQRRGGHIPGARLVPYKKLYGPDGRYVSEDELRKLTGFSGDTPAPVTYCTGGVRSALLAVLLEARLGVVARNYDGSMWEWSARADLPMKEGGEGSTIPP